MNKKLILLCLTFFSNILLAESSSQHGNVNIKQSLGKRIVNDDTVKLYQANYNTWLMCVYPKLWEAKKISTDEFYRQLDKFSQSTNPEENWISSSYSKGLYQLNEDYFVDEQNYDELLTGGALSEKFFEIRSHLNNQDKNATLVTHCDQDWGAVLKKRRVKLGLSY